MVPRTKRSASVCLLALTLGGCSGVSPGVLFDGPSSTGGTQGGTPQGPVDTGAGASADAGSAPVAPSPAIDAGSGAPEAGIEPTDAGSSVVDAGPVACTVTFIVTGALVDGLTYTGAYLGGDTATLGDWDATKAVPLVPIASGAWTTNLTMNDGDVIQFRFLERGPLALQWENWGQNSNRSLRVGCLTTASSAVTLEAGSSPVVGTEYTGQFDVKPPDAT